MAIIAVSLVPRSAREKGIVHRDLKRANMKITPEDRVKVLDFGLAKATEDAPANRTMSNSPTLSLAATQAGVVLGTAGVHQPASVPHPAYAYSSRGKPSGVGRHFILAIIAPPGLRHGLCVGLAPPFKSRRSAGQKRCSHWRPACVGQPNFVTLAAKLSYGPLVIAAGSHRWPNRPSLR
jgi:serine/threonine protein kinase